MIESVTSSATYVEFRLTAFDGTAVTGALIGSFAVAPVAKLLPAGASSVAASIISEIGDGWYTAVFASGLSVGDWIYYHTYDTDNDWYERIHVIPAAADPAAIATAVAAVQTTVDGVAAMTDVATSTRAIAGAVISSSSPVTSQGSIEIVQGDAYQSADNRALSFSLTSAPDLTGATVTLVISWGVDSVSVTGTVANAGAATQTVTAQLTSVQTALMPIIGTTYQLRATLANTNVVTLKRGRVLVVPPVPAN